MSTLEKYGIEKSNEKIDSGVSEKTMGFVNGEKVMIKSDGNQVEPFAEYFAYQLGSALGLPINKVKLVDCGKLLGLHQLCSVHWWEEDFIKASKWDGLVKQQEYATLEFFDGLIANEDRHDGNYGFVNDKLFIIDHGLSYPWRNFDSDDIDKLQKNYKKVPFLVEKFMSLTDDDFFKMLELPKDLEHEIEQDIIDEIVERMKEAKNILEEVINNESNAA